MIHIAAFIESPSFSDVATSTAADTLTMLCYEFHICTLHLCICYEMKREEYRLLCFCPLANRTVPLQTTAAEIATAKKI